MASSIERQFLGRRDLFGLKWQDGYTFHEVMDYEDSKVKPYQEFGDVEPKSSTKFNRLNDSGGDDILFVPLDKSNRILHAGIGHRPSILRRYTYYPEGQARMGNLPNLQTPHAGGDFGYIDGEDSPYESPTDRGSVVAPPGVRTTISFHNPGDDIHTPVMNIVARVYRVNNLDIELDRDKKAISRIVSPGTAPPVFTIGSLSTQDDIGTLLGKWDVSPRQLDEVRRRL